MTLHEDVARIKVGDRVTIEIMHDGVPVEAGSVVTAGDLSLKVGPFAIAYRASEDSRYYATGNVVRIIAHEPAPAPLYANRPDIQAPRPYDVVAAENYPGGEVIPLTFWNNLWRSHGGMQWTTEKLLEVGPLTLLATAQP